MGLSTAEEIQDTLDAEMNSNGGYSVNLENLKQHSQPKTENAKNVEAETVVVKNEQVNKETGEVTTQQPAQAETKSSSPEMTAEEKAAIAAAERAEAEAAEQGQQTETTTRAARTTRARAQASIE